MKRAALILAFITLFLFLTPSSVSAAEDDFVFDPGVLTGTLDSESRSLLPTDPGSESGAFEAGKNIFFETVSSMIKAFAKDVLLLCGMIILASALSRIGESLSLKYSTDIFSLAQVLLIALTCYNMIDGVFGISIDYIEHMNSLMTSYGAVSAEMYLLGGNISGAAVGSAWLALILEASRRISVGTLIPLIRICFSVSVASSVSGALDLRAISKFISGLYASCSVLFMTVITVIMSFQNTVAFSKDSVALRSVRFAASNTIPIIGSLVGESMRTLLSGLSLMKSSSGLICILCLLALSAIPLGTLLASRFTFALTSAFSEFLGVENAGRILSDCRIMINYLTGIVVITDIYFIYYITVFMRSASAIG